LPNNPTQLLPDVYPFAAYLGRLFGCRYVIGLGETAAENLIDFHPEFEIIGIVNEANLRKYRGQYQFGTWLGLNETSSRGDLLADNILEQAIIVCTDLDQLERPTDLLKILKSWLNHAPAGILTAAEKDLNAGTNCAGEEPQTHPAKWSLATMEYLLQVSGLNVEFIGLTASDNVRCEKKTIIAVMTHDSHSLTRNISSLKTPSDFRVVAFMAAYNEEDIIVQSIKKWTDQGVAVHVLENWSTDATYDLLKESATRLPVTIERFPKEGPSKHFNWGAMLARIEELSREIEADWFVRRGADEVLTPPWPGVSYRDALYLVDLAGFNCVDHTVVEFNPVDDAFEAGADYEAYFRHFAFGTNKAHFQQRKAWKNYGQSVSMAESGGHDLPFADRRIYPFKFLLKHYPVRSQKHGEKKIFRERKDRWNPEERAKGWHDHYDQIEEDHAFVISPSALNTFEEADFNKTRLVERLSGIGVIRSDRDRAHKLRLRVQELDLRLAEKEAQLESLQALTIRLAEKEAQLKEITTSLGWRLLSRYGPIKYGVLLPAYKRIVEIFKAESHVGNDQGDASPATNQDEHNTVRAARMHTHSSTLKPNRKDSD